MSETIIVDVANVMGSRPDGWWNDRAGAAERLCASVRALISDRTAYIMVLEGRACAADVRDSPGMAVVRAPGSGDDTIAKLAGPGKMVVTADRELRRRCEQAGAEVQGPRWLLHQLSLHILALEVADPPSSASTAVWN
jgi:8-oxo-dGTP diphosphatase